MGWIKVDDSFYDNDKMLAAGTIGRDLYWHGMAFCNRNLTDGLIPRGKALCLVDFTDAAVVVGSVGVDGQDCAPLAVKRLLEVNLWHTDGHDCPTCAQPGPRHYIVHDYLKYQPSKDEVHKKAADNKKRVEAWRKSQQDKNAVSNAVGNALQTLHVQDTPTPNPTPTNSSLVTKEGGVALVDARGPNAPRPQCSKHPNGNLNDEPCRGCGRVREWDKANAAAIQADELDAKRRQRELADQCSDCHGTNTIEVGDNAARICNHPNVRLKENA